MQDLKQDAPAFHRNVEPITEILHERITCETGNVLEIGSGTGQHVTRFSGEFPSLNFFPTDAFSENLSSIDAWASEMNLKNVRRARLLDVCASQWTDGQDNWPESFQVILSFNVIHISPWEVTQNLMRGAAEHLTADGQLILYGPYRVNGEQTAPSNQQFEGWLKAKDERFGVRDISDVEREAGKHELKLAAFHPMPSNNFMPVFTRS